MRSTRRRYVRRMPKIYGNLQPQKRKLPSLPIGKAIKVILPYAVIVGLMYLLFASSVFKVKTVEVRGTGLSDAASLTKLVPTGGSIWSFPKAEVKAELLKNPAIADVQILRGMPSTILIEVTERSAQAVWITGTTAAVLDDRGQVFLSYPEASIPAADTETGIVLAALPRVVDTSGLSAEEGVQVASSLFLTFVNDIKKNMTELLPLYEIDHFEVGATTYDITMVTKPGLKVLLNGLGDAGVQARNLARLERDGKLTGAQSVDLRVDRWAYVK